MDTELASFVAAGRDYAARIGFTTDDDGFISVLRIVALLDRRKKRIHIDMDDFTRRTVHTGLLFIRQFQVSDDVPVGKRKRQLIGAEG